MSEELEITGLELAKEFHEIYERLAPMFDYVTRKDAKIFNKESKNGRLMVAVCNDILDYLESRAFNATMCICPKVETVDLIADECPDVAENELVIAVVTEHVRLIADLFERVGNLEDNQDDVWEVECPECEHVYQSTPARSKEEI